MQQINRFQNLFKPTECTCCKKQLTINDVYVKDITEDMLGRQFKAMIWYDCLACKSTKTQIIDAIDLFELNMKEVV